MLEKLVSAQDQQWDDQRIDRFLQVVFDLQTVQQHQQALLLFSAVLEKPVTMQQRRELLFWTADSLQALEKYDEAAYLYLKSATLQDPMAMDPWAQTARYHAAKMLAEAGLVDDARQIYSSLLRATRDASRRAVLENEIQRLHLVKASRRKGE
jgi:tetratricopeptide (TPR) repeat protein